MGKYHIVYVEKDTINKKELVEADSALDAVVKFTMEHPLISEITRIEEVM